MLEYIFKAILISSLLGTAATLILTILKPITRKVFSSSWHYYMWLLVLVTMILPLRITIPVQMQTVSTIDTVDVLYEEEIIYNPIQQVEQEIQLNTEQENNTDSGIEKLSLYTQKNLYIISIIWLLGMVVLFALKLFGYTFFLIKLRRCSDKISCPELLKYTNKRIITRTSDKISSPLMIGLFKPTLLLPKTTMTEEQFDNILAHEMVHFKRKDIWYKWFISIVKCIHWYNPTVYYISKQADIECEISCDLAVVKGMSEEQETNYINTILTLLAAGNQRKAALTTGMTSDKKTLKRRFTMIKNKVKFNKKTLIISLILALVVLCGTVLASGLLNGKILNEYENELLAVSTDARENDNFNFLVLGVDENNRADTIMLLSFEDGNVTGTSIPRDTAFISKELDRKVKLSEILNSENGNQKVIDAVRDTLSVPITYYAKVNLSAVKEIVDSVGGIEIDVPMDMEYDDPHKNLHIKLKQGRHTLNGDAVCGLLQFRRSNNGTGYPQGDMTRIEVGQQVISEFIKQKLNKEFIDKSPDIFKILADNMETNYPVSNLMNDIKLLDKMKSNIEFRIIDGTLNADETGIMFYDINNGEVVSVVSKPKLVTDEQSETVSQPKTTLDVTVNENEDVELKKIELNKDVANPVEGEVSLNFGKREHPITKEIHEHNGIDIKAPEGTDVVTSITGTVTDVGFDSEKGNYIVVENGNVKTLYAQLASTSVKKGDKVTAKQSIGTVGKTGTATGAHLHFEVIVDGEYVDPAAYIK
ncbi:MAG: LCP family protein [Clostridia bacterium]|nr:LCP family protein [Clostridia bacterium]